MHADKGNAAKFYQLFIVKKLGMKKIITKKSSLLSGCNGATCTTVDTIELDDYTPLIVNPQKFAIIDEPSLYNNILSKP